MDRTELEMTVADLVGVEPKSIGTDAQASEAAQWIDLQKKTEAEADTLLDPAIREAFGKHRALTGEKKKLLKKLLAAKDRVRVSLANWIAGGHAVEGCYIVTKWKVAMTDLATLPDEYKVTVADVAKIQEWVNTTQGQQPVPGCTIEPVHILYSREVEP